PTPSSSPLSLHDALPISSHGDIRKEYRHTLYDRLFRPVRALLSDGHKGRNNGHIYLRGSPIIYIVACPSNCRHSFPFNCVTFFSRYPADSRRPTLRPSSNPSAYALRLNPRCTSSLYANTSSACPSSSSKSNSIIRNTVNFSIEFVMRLASFILSSPLYIYYVLIL